MHNYSDRFRKVILWLCVCWMIPSTTFGQGEEGWTAEAPPGSVQLISVGVGKLVGPLWFTFKNVSDKTIIEFRVDTLHGNMTGFDAFTTGIGAVAPGKTGSVSFGARELTFADREPKKLSVAAVVYTDGSSAGAPKTLALVQDEMLGAALETKRISDILGASQDPSIGGLDNVVAQIGTELPASEKEAADSVRGIALPGVAQAYLDERLARPSFGLEVGIRKARQTILGAIENIKRADTREMAGSETQQRYALEAREHTVSDLGRRYSALSAAQVRVITSLSLAPKVN